MIRAVLIKFSIFHKKKLAKRFTVQAPRWIRSLLRRFHPTVKLTVSWKLFLARQHFAKNVKSCRIRTFIPDNVESFRFWAFFETLEENKIILVPHFGQILVDWVNFYGLGNFFSWLRIWRYLREICWLWFLLRAWAFLISRLSFLHQKPGS